MINVSLLWCHLIGEKWFSDVLLLEQNIIRNLFLMCRWDHLIYIVI
jgi:hypothetical protein